MSLFFKPIFRIEVDGLQKWLIHPWNSNFLNFQLVQSNFWSDQNVAFESQIDYHFRMEEVLMDILPPFENDNPPASHLSVLQLFKNSKAPKYPLWSWCFKDVSFAALHDLLLGEILLSKIKSRGKKRRVSISLIEILFLHWFCVKSQQSLFTFQSFCIILVKSFLQELSNLCQSAIWINKKVNKLSQNISNSRKGITIFERR